MNESYYNRLTYLALACLLTSFMVSVIEFGSFGVVHFAKLFLQFDGSVLIGWLFVWMWGWPVWWANILMLFEWFGSFMVLLEAMASMSAQRPPARPMQSMPKNLQQELEQTVKDMENSGDSWAQGYARQLREAMGKQ